MDVHSGSPGTSTNKNSYRYYYIIIWKFKKLGHWFQTDLRGGLISQQVCGLATFRRKDGGGRGLVGNMGPPSLEF